MTPRRGTAALVAAFVGALVLPAPAGADTIRDREWFLPALRVPAAQQAAGDGRVLVAVIDTGVDAGHVDLKGSVLPGTDLFDGHGDGTSDPNGHGTMMAGLIAGHGHGAGGGDGVLGLDPAAKILPITVSNGSAIGPDLLPQALTFALSHSAAVILISLAGPPTIADAAAITKAELAGAVLVAGVGDAPVASPQFPASYPGVVGVAGTDQNGKHAAISAVGPGAVLSAPATNIVSTLNTGGYGESNGTGAAAAIVAGAVALVQSKYPDMPGADIVQRLTATAADLGAPGRDNTYGYGLPNIVAALTADLPSATPSVSASSPSPSSTPTPSPSAAPVETTSPEPSAAPDRGLPMRIGLAIGAGVVLIGAGLWILSRRRT